MNFSLPASANKAPIRKLIEVSMPLEKVNEALKAEKDRKVGKPQQIHHWWARRPITAARAVLFAQLVDDPSSHPELFSTDEEIAVERRRLHKLLVRLVQWDSTYDEAILDEARLEIRRWTGGAPPAILDPFAGGGAIPLEAQRLGLHAHASDLNPVPVLINKALIELPPIFSGSSPVFPGAAESTLGGWPRALGLAEDVRRYGALLRDRATQRIGHLYPPAKLPSGETATAIAWIWVRLVTCWNPACGIQMPLTSTWWLSKKKGKEAFVIPAIIDDPSAPGGRRVTFSIGHDPKSAPPRVTEGTVGQSGATCIACGTAVELKHIRSEGKAKRLGTQLMAVVAQGNRKRIYLPPTLEHTEHSNVPRPTDGPAGDLPTAALGFRVQGYGMSEWTDIFTDRQLLALTTLSDLVREIRSQVVKDALAADLDAGERLSDGGSGAEAYADVVATYLGLALSRLADWSNSLCRWESNGQVSQQSYGRQSVTWTWDFSEANTLASSSGSFDAAIKAVARALELSRASGPATVTQADAAQRSYDNLVIATDPPYYDNIGYADLSDLFYIWLRKTLRDVHPSLFSTMLVPKAEELVAEPFRHGGGENAERFFEEGFQRVFGHARASASADYPITVFYAFKQAELEKEGVASTGWSTFLEGLVRQGWTITATWPVRSEMESRMRGQSANALASSIVLALRPREISAPATDRSGFLAALHRELEHALPEIRQGSIAPADLRQTVLGPGMAVFSRYSRVLEDDGTHVSVKTALALINQTFDAIESEQDTDLDPDTRFCLDWFKSYGWSTRPYGDAESLSVPLGLSVAGIARGGVILSGGGKVSLVKPQDLDAKWNPATDDRLSLWEVTCHLARVYAAEGREAAARLMASAGPKVNIDAVNRLATRLYELMESKDAGTASLFNGLGGAWADVSQTARSIRPPAIQDTFNFDEDED
ncbi:DUF1156 domain-containing protein [Arthrobacter sp. NicSoilB8]|uniref:DUF1156 domain-containing protein n=1 Tax=Arthrobacter sp. NicSoilB8 TaxID=2830998 RepID=UPI001CC6A79A|nr:DUF1156 domain-containing protein [Arthrobacter sp. NicSoilB8]BCW69971.1 hypothetical protein NicSoilB8_10150 [Arthrobacter sp. NicSoilB8]